MKEREKISAVLIVQNEAKRLEACLRSLSWTDEVVLVDGGSEDETVTLAEQFGCKVYRRPFDNFEDQKNFGIDQAGGDWIFSIDADEVISPELEVSLREVVQRRSSYNGFYVTRTNFIFGRQLRYGGQGPEKILRFFRKGRGKFEQPIHERVVVEEPVGELRGELLHDSSPSIEQYLRKLRQYTELEAAWLAVRGVRPAHFNLWLAPVLRFVYDYLIRRGFLDGYEGFLYLSLSSFYQILKYARLAEIYNQQEKHRH